MKKTERTVERVKRTGKVRTIYSNYNLWSDYLESAIETYHMNNEDDKSEPTKDEIWEIINEIDSTNYMVEVEALKKFMYGENWIATGNCGLWNGTFSAGVIFDDLSDFLSQLSYDSIHIYDINGHLHIECAHHDGSNHFEIKKITDKGYDYYTGWETSYNDNRSEEYVHKQIFEKYSTLPHFLHKEYGLKKIENEVA